MRANRGFTLVELSVTVAIIGILAVLTFAVTGAALRSANVGAAAYELSLRVPGIRSAAMAEGAEFLLVFADAPDNDASRCTRFSMGTCARYFVLKDPPAPWTDATVRAFDVSSPGASATVQDSWVLPPNARLYLEASGAKPPPPFDGVALLDEDVAVSCGGNRKCFAVRFTASGRVEPVVATGASDKTGFAFILHADSSEESARQRRGLVIGFPSGLTKAFSF